MSSSSKGGDEFEISPYPPSSSVEEDGVAGVGGGTKTKISDRSSEATMVDVDIERKQLLPTTTTVKPRPSPSPASQHSTAAKIGSALFYAVSSLSVVFVNKIILSTFEFPSVLFLACCQFLSTTIALRICHHLGYVRLRPFVWSNVRPVLPLTVCFLLNILSGLSATRSLSLPMMVLLRRASIPMTMLLEKRLLNTHPSKPVQISVALMMGGALIAALGDLSFNLQGYVVIFANDVFTALNGVIMKRTAEEFRSAKMSVLYYNSLTSAVGVAVILSVFRSSELSDALRFDGWRRGGDSFGFPPLFAFASLMGSVLNLSIFLCTSTNSALTTTVVGCLKNVLTSYVGMTIGGDYVFSWLNFTGINVSIAGSLLYAKATFRRK